MPLLSSNSVSNVALISSLPTSDYAAKVDYTVGSSPYSVTTADVNGDGKADLIVANRNSGSVSVLTNKGDGTFNAKVDYTAGSWLYSVTSADVNGDGKADLITANYGSDSVSVLTNRGDGTFNAKIDYTAGSRPSSVTTADVNGDGKADLIVANRFSDSVPYNSYSVSVLTNRGDGTFNTKVDYTVGDSPYSVTTADVNGDGKADLIVANGASNTVSVLTNRGDGTFNAKVDYTVGSSPYSVTTADVNGDGKADLIAANFCSDSVSVLTNKGDGTFNSKVDYTTGHFPWSVTTADVNGDGKADLITANYTSASVSVLSSSTTQGIASISGTTANDNLTGTSGNESISGLAGNDTLDGGDGIDTACYSSARTNYTVTKTTTSLTVQDNYSTEGNDTLLNIERLQFTDKGIAFDTSGNAGEAYRVYQAAFNRTPDSGGLGYWIKQMDNGLSLLDVSSGFVNSAEFKSIYGQSPANPDIVTRFYQNVLHRASEQSGFDYWVNELNSGHQTVAQVLAGFSESPENQAQLIGVISNGMEYTIYTG